MTGDLCIIHDCGRLVSVILLVQWEMQCSFWLRCTARGGLTIKQSIDFNTTLSSLLDLYFTDFT